MPEGLVPIEPPPNRPHATRTYAVLHQGAIIGTIYLTHTTRPSGSIRREWWALRTLPERHEHPRPFTSADNAAQAVRYQYDRLTRTPRPDPIDVTLQSVQDARDEGGTAAALWLAATVIRHHISELETNRTANPPALWRELHRISNWLQAATHNPGNPSDSQAAVHYRRSFQRLAVEDADPAAGPAAPRSEYLDRAEHGAEAVPDRRSDHGPYDREFERPDQPR